MCLIIVAAFQRRSGPSFPPYMQARFAVGSNFPDGLLKTDYFQESFWAKAYMFFEDADEVLLRKADLFRKLCYGQLMGRLQDLGDGIFYKGIGNKLPGKCVEEVLLCIQKFLLNTFAQQQCIAQVQYLVGHHKFTIHHVICKLMHGHFHKRICPAFMKVNDEHFAIPSRRNRDIFFPDTRKPDIPAGLNFLQRIVVVNVFRVIGQVENHIGIAIG